MFLLLCLSFITCHSYTFLLNPQLGTASMDRGLGATKPALRKVSAYATTLDRRNEHTTRRAFSPLAGSRTAPLRCAMPQALGLLFAAERPLAAPCRARRLARPRHVVFRNVHDATAEVRAGARQNCHPQAHRCNPHPCRQAPIRLLQSADLDRLSVPSYPSTHLSCPVVPVAPPAFALRRRNSLYTRRSWPSS